MSVSTTQQLNNLTLNAEHLVSFPFSVGEGWLGIFLTTNFAPKFRFSAFSQGISAEWAKKEEGVFRK